MISGLSVSASGLQDAATRLAISASRIARSPDTAGKSSFVDINTQAEFSGTSAPTHGTGRMTELINTPPADSQLYTPSYSEDLLSMRLAVQAYKANAKMLRAHAEIANELLAVTGAPGKTQVR